MNRDFETIFLKVKYSAFEIIDEGDYYTAPYYEYCVEIDEVILLGCDDDIEVDLTYLFKDYYPLICKLKDYYDGSGKFKREIELNVPTDFYYSNNLKEYYYE